MLGLINKMPRTSTVEGKPRTEQSPVLLQLQDTQNQVLERSLSRVKSSRATALGTQSWEKTTHRNSTCCRTAKETHFWPLNIQNNSQNLPQETILSYLLGRESCHRPMPNVCLHLISVWRESTRELTYQLTPPLGNTASKGSAQQLGQLETK